MRQRNLDPGFLAMEEPTVAIRPDHGEIARSPWRGNVHAMKAREKKPPVEGRSAGGIDTRIPGGRQHHGMGNGDRHRLC